jgi:16S rRNA (uracil1498-N3)-methyltransferase
MHRFYLPPSLTQQATLALSEGEAYHALQVLRLGPGERVTVLDGAGHEFLCEIARCHRREAELKLVEKRTHPALPCRITLLQAIPKGKTFEEIIQKATELGAARIVPLMSERVVVRLSGKEAAQKQAKWQGVAVEAIKQCGAAWLPEVTAPLTPAEFLARGEEVELSLAGSLQSDSRHPRGYFHAFHEKHGRLPRSVWIWIGPEGDFTLGELEAIQSAGAKPITLGPLVLRADTAALYCLSVVNYEMTGGQRDA